MGHLVNPISARLGIVRVWNSTWVSNKGLFYSYLLAKDLELQKSLEIFFYKTNSTDFWSIIFDKALIFRTSKRVYVFIVLYSWKFFSMFDNILKILSQGHHVGFTDAFSDDSQNKKNFAFGNVSVKGVKNVLNVYSRVVVDSFNTFKKKTIISVQQELVSLLFWRCIQNYFLVRDRYLFFFKLLKDFFLLRFMYSVFIKKGFSKNSKYSLKLFIFLNLLCNKFNKYILFLCKVFSGTFLKVIKQRLTFYLRKKFFLQHSFIFIKKILSLKGYRKRKIFVFLRKFNRLLFRGILFGRFLYSLKCYFGNTFFLLISHLKRKKSLRFVFKLPKFTTVNRHSFFVLYIKNLVGIYNYKMNLFLSLLRHNYTWWLFVLIKIFLRKHMAVFYGKRLWYIRSFVTYFFGYKNKQSTNFFVYFLFPSFLILTARMLSYVIRIRLTQKYSLGEVLNKFVIYLDKQPNLIGYRITCHGRFTRRQRASHKMVKSSLKYKDRLLLNTFTGIVDYAYVEEPLKYGMCGIRIWLVKQDTNYHKEKYCFSLKNVFVSIRYRRQALFLKKLAKLRLYMSNFDMYNKFISYKKRAYFFQKQLFKLKRFMKSFHFKYYIYFNKLIGIPFSFRNKYQSEFFIEEFKKKFYLLY